MTALTQSFFTPEQYLAMECQASYKSEYINGCIFAMAGASKEHNQIAFNIAGELHGQLKNRPCLAYVNDLRVKVSATGLYTYPDTVALCGEPHFEDERMDTLLNPSVIIEILSPTTEAYDRGVINCGRGGFRVWRPGESTPRGTGSRSGRTPGL